MILRMTYNLRSGVSDIQESIVKRTYEMYRFSELTNDNGNQMTLEEYSELVKTLTEERCSFIFCRDINGDYLPLECASGTLRPKMMR